MTCRHGTKEGYPCERCYFGVNLKGLTWVIMLLTCLWPIGLAKIIGWM